MSVDTPHTICHTRAGSRSYRSPARSSAGELAKHIASRAGSCAGADFSNVALLNGAGDRLHVFHAPVLDSTIAGRYTELHVDAPYPITQAAMGHVVLLPDLGAYCARFPNLVIDTVAAGYQSSASVPMYRADGSLLGAIGFAWTTPTEFDATLQDRLGAIALLCTAPIERAERDDAEHALVIALQDRLLGDIPMVHGLHSAACYLPAVRALSVGGDWYEGLVLSPTRMAVAVGDLSGHGVGAAADMASVRGTISALLHAGIPVSQVFGQVSGVLNQHESLMLATAALAVIDVGAATVTFATAGHPPPLLRYPNGHVRQLSTANGPLIGTSLSRDVADTAPFPSGSQLVMYTDGLVERRDRRFDVGIAQAAQHLAALPPRRIHQHELIGSLLDELLGDAEPEDDIAVVVVEHE